MTFLSLDSSSKNQSNGLFKRLLVSSLASLCTCLTVGYQMIKSSRPSVKSLAVMTAFIFTLTLGVMIQRSFSTPYDFLPLLVLASMCFSIILAWLCQAWEVITSGSRSTTSEQDSK